MDIIKNFASTSGIAASLFTATYFIVRLPLYESSNINKTEFNKDTVKGLTIVFIVCFILFISYFIFSDKIKSLSSSYIGLFLGYTILYLYFYIKVENKRKSIVNASDSYIKDKFSYEIYQLLSILIIFIIAFPIKEAIYKLIFSMDHEKTFDIVFFVIKYIFLYLITMLAVSYIMAYGKLFNFTRYLIFSKKFPDKKTIGYLLFENDEEILIKCDESYPIIFKKADIDTYMEIPYSAFMGEDKKIHINNIYSGIYKDEFVINELKVDEKSLFNPYVFNIREIVIWTLIIFFGCFIYSSDNSFKFHVIIILGIVIMIIIRAIFFITKSLRRKYLYEYNRGNLYYNLCKYEKAVDCYEKAIKLNSHSVYAHKNRCKALFMLDETIESN